jgi:hypothetical protein
MKKSLFLFLIIISIKTFAQDKNAQKFAATITPSELKEKLTIIAGADMQGRETATEGQRKAASYIENYFKKLKLLPGDSGKYQMSFPVFQDSITAASFKVNDKTFSFANDFSVEGRNIPQNTFNLSDVVFAGRGLKDSTHNDYDSLNVRQKWVMITTTPDDERSFRLLTRKINFAMEGDAEGVLFVSDNFPKKQSSYKGRMYLQSSTLIGGLNPVLFISRKLAEALLNTSINADTKRQVYTTNATINIAKTTNNLQSTDVIGVLPGSDKKSEYVFITAHYDHLGMQDSVIYYGADDDGSGTTSVLQLAEAFAAARDKGFTPRRTIVFMTVSGEEKGLWGSEYYTNHPLFPLDSTSVDLNIDMVGRIDPSRNYGDSTNYVYTIGEDKLSSDLMPVSDSINNTYSHLELDRKFNDPKDPNRFYYRSDHYNFASKGVPIIFYFNGTHADYHKPTDTVDKINFDLMAKRAKLVFYTAWAMANRDSMLKRDIPLNQK